MIVLLPLARRPGVERTLWYVALLLLAWLGIATAAGARLRHIRRPLRIVDLRNSYPPSLCERMCAPIYKCSNLFADVRGRLGAGGVGSETRDTVRARRSRQYCPDVLALLLRVLMCARVPCLLAILKMRMRSRVVFQPSDLIIIEGK